VKTHSAQRRLTVSQSGARLLYARTKLRALGFFAAGLAIAVSLILSGCGSTAASGSSNGAASALASAPSSPAQSNTVSSHDVSLRWDASASSGILGYNVYRATGSGGPYMKLNSSIVSATNYTDNAVQSGQTYYYVVTAMDTENLESAYSTEIAAVIP
jgi:fibronectin type 3 domain-containing protein